MNAAALHHGFSFDEHFKPIVTGKVEVPNFEEIELSKGVAAIAAGGGLATVNGVKNAKIPGSKSSWGHWARYFLSTNQGGGYDGRGYVMFYEHGVGRIGRFAICKHDYVNTSTPERERRGYHTGYCPKCGLDMSVDSSD